MRRWATPFPTDTKIQVGWYQPRTTSSPPHHVPEQRDQREHRRVHLRPAGSSLVRRRDAEVLISDRAAPPAQAQGDWRPPRLLPARPFSPVLLSSMTEAFLQRAVMLFEAEPARRPPKLSAGSCWRCSPAHLACAGACWGAILLHAARALSPRPRPCSPSLREAARRAHHWMNLGHRPRGAGQVRRSTARAYMRAAESGCATGADFISTVGLTHIGPTRLRSRPACRVEKGAGLAPDDALDPLEYIKACYETRADRRSDSRPPRLDRILAAARRASSPMSGQRLMNPGETERAEHVHHRARRQRASTCARC